MSISKVIILNFSDGTNTVYTKQSTLYIPFEVDNFKIVNTYSTFEGGGATPESYSITSDLVQGSQNFLTLGRYFTSCNPTDHIYQIPRPINGTYNFTVNFSNTLNTFSIDTHTRNRIRGSVAPTTDQFVWDYLDASPGEQPPENNMLNVLDKFYDSLGNAIVPPLYFTDYDDVTHTYTLNRTIATGLPAGYYLYYTYTDKIHIPADNLDSRAIGNSSSYLNSGGVKIDPTTYIESVHPDGVPYYRLNRSLLLGSNGVNSQTLTYIVPYVYNFYNLTHAEIAIDIEFYEKFKLYEDLKIQNYQYVLWQIENLTDATKYIDIPFPVDEIEITNADMMNDNEYPIYGYFSNLINSSTTDQDLLNKNYTNGIFFNSYTTSHYQTNKKRFLFSNPRFFSGQYNVYSRYLIDNTINDITSAETIYFQIKFIQYKKEIGDRTK